MRGAVTLSERRGAFVSAVTHELRTPLTTFRMYTEMLADGMVDERRRDRYVRTLQAEAERLGHLVENVLAYARLERNRHGGRVEVLPVAEVVARCQEHLAARAAQAEMTLVVAIDAAADAELRVDAAAVERVLFNLVDNACKYAASATDRRIHLEAGAPAGGAVTLRVRDHGPGVDPRDARRLFRPFSKSAKEAAQTAPGVGLGLALGRRLARAMGGALRVEPNTTERGGGACFALQLPLA
jgi:signal transduction histidine kinase